MNRRIQEPLKQQIWNKMNSKISSYINLIPADLFTPAIIFSTFYWNVTLIQKTESQT